MKVNKNICKICLDDFEEYLVKLKPTSATEMAIKGGSFALLDIRRKELELDKDATFPSSMWCESCQYVLEHKVLSQDEKEIQAK